MKRCLVLLSGGQDSVTCLGLALKEYDHVTAIAFDYGQRHKVELDGARLICVAFGIHLEVMGIPALAQINDSALLDTTRDVTEPHPSNADLPASFVPNRNAMFLTIAHAYAQKIGAYTVIAGMCQTDYSGYPDCRESFVKQLRDALNQGYLTTIEFETPLMHLDKAATFQLADDIGFLDQVLELSHTCYLGDRTEMHDWGYGCGECPACILRRNGYEAFRANQQGAIDPDEAQVY